VTPAAGFIQPWGAFVLGICASVLCYICCEKARWLGFDDALDVWGVHGMGGFIGTVLLGALADPAECAPGDSGATAPTWCVNPDTITRSPEQFGKQLIAAVFCASYSMVVTFAMLKALDLVVPLKPPAEGSLDQHEHGEQAYSPNKAYTMENQSPEKETKV